MRFIRTAAIVASKRTGADNSAGEGDISLKKSIRLAIAGAAASALMALGATTAVAAPYGHGGGGFHGVAGGAHGFGGGMRGGFAGRSGGWAGRGYAGRGYAGRGWDGRDWDGHDWGGRGRYRGGYGWGGYGGYGWDDDDWGYGYAPFLGGLALGAAIDPYYYDDPYDDGYGYGYGYGDCGWVWDPAYGQYVPGC